MLRCWWGEENLCVLSRQVSQPGAELSSYPRHPLFGFSELVRKCKQNDHLNDWDKRVRSSQQQLWNVLQRPCELVLSSTSPLLLPRLSLVSWGGIDNRQNLFFHISKSPITTTWCNMVSSHQHNAYVYQQKTIEPAIAELPVPVIDPAKPSQDLRPSIRPSWLLLFIFHLFWKW